MAAAARPFSETEQARFRALLALAAESPFDGERANALAAAARFAARHGMTLEEAARREPPSDRPRRRTQRFRRPQPRAACAFAFAGFGDSRVQADKLRREAALREAIARGLDRDRRGGSGEPRPAARWRRASVRRSPLSHARVLLAETSLPLREIVSLTGLDIYQVVGLKLKMRRAV